MKIRIENPIIYAPPKVETAADLAARTRKSEKWILTRTGVARRHVCDEPVERMSARAVRLALGDGPKPDLLINASLTPRQLIPDTSCFVLRELDWHGVASFSVHLTCQSFLAAVHVASGLVTAGAYQRVVVVSSEGGTVCRNYDEPESAVLIGDGAAAAVITATPQGERSELLAYEMSTWPEGAELAEIRGCGVFRHPNDANTVIADNLFHMNGPRIYRMAHRKVEELLERLLAKAGLTRDDIDVVVPHQASGPALGALDSFGLPADKVINIVGEYGNCVAASLPMALGHANAIGRLQRGKHVLMLATGAGLTVGGAVLRW